MSIKALITEGVGPGGSVKYLLTGGFDAAVPVVHQAFFPVLAPMRNAPAAALGAMVKSPVPSVGAISHTLAVFAVMQSAKVPSKGTMGNGPVASVGAMP